MKRQTIVECFDDTNIATLVRRHGSSLRLIAKDDLSVIYAEADDDRYISVENWIDDRSLDVVKSVYGWEYPMHTPAAFGTALHKALYPDDYKLTRQGSDGYSAIAARNALYGGRCEAVKRTEDTFVALFEYDINMSYPYSAMTGIFPDISTGRYTSRGTLDNIRLYEGVSEITFSQDGDIPVLPIRQKDGIVYAICDHCTGWYTHTEIRFALLMGVTVHAVRRQYCYDALLQSPYQRIMKELSDHRRNDGERIWKVIANSMLGRLASTNTGSLIQLKRSTNLREIHQTANALKIEYAGCAFVGTKTPRSKKPQTGALHSAYILAMARNRITEAAIRYNAVYYDTDCIFTEERIEDIDIGKDIGQWKEVYGSFNIAGAKLYVRDTDGILKIVQAGVPSQLHSMASFHAARGTQDRINLDNGRTKPYDIAHETSVEQFDIFGGSSIDATPNSERIIRGYRKRG